MPKIDDIMVCQTSPSRRACADGWNGCERCWHGGMESALQLGSFKKMLEGSNPLHVLEIDSDFVNSSPEHIRKLCKERWPYWNNVEGWNKKLLMLMPTLM